MIKYLEISARRMGKTTRMIELADQLLACGYSIVIIGYRISIYPDRLKQYFRVKIPKEKFLPDVVLVDEFELLKLSRNYSFEKADYYIAGTPKWDSDIAKMLVKEKLTYCKYRYEPNFDNMINDQEEYWSRNKEEYKAQILGEYKDND